MNHEPPITAVACVLLSTDWPDLMLQVCPYRESNSAAIQAALR